MWLGSCKGPEKKRRKKQHRVSVFYLSRGEPHVAFVNESPWAHVVPPRRRWRCFASLRSVTWRANSRRGERETEDEKARAKPYSCTRGRSRVRKRARTPARDHVCESSPSRLHRGCLHPRALLPVDGVASARCAAAGAAAAASPPPPFRSPSGRSYVAESRPAHSSSPLQSLVERCAHTLTQLFLLLLLYLLFLLMFLDRTFSGRPTWTSSWDTLEPWTAWPMDWKSCRALLGLLGDFFFLFNW